MNWKRILKYAFWIAVLAAGIYWANETLKANKATMEANSKKSEERNAVIPVKTAIVGTVKWDGSFEVVGSFAPYKQVAIMAEMAGKIVSLNLQNGQYVKAGEQLLATDNELLKIQSETAVTNLAKAENDLKRLKNLLGDGGVTQQQVDDAQLAIANLESQIKGLKKQISMTYVKAPIAGIVSNKMVEKGSLVAPGNPIATITNVSRLKLQVYLTEAQVVTVKKGQPVSIIADLFPDKKLEGQVTFVDVMAGPSRRYLVEVEVPNIGNDLKAGMTATAYFAGLPAGKAGGKSQEMLAVPRESIVGDLQDAKIYVVEGGVAKLRPIVTGVAIGSDIQVKSGLTAGEQIVLSGQINLEDGKAISIEE